MTAPRTLLTDIIAAARANPLVEEMVADAKAEDAKAADLAEAARAARLEESNRLARSAAAHVAEGDTETAVELLHDAIALLTAA
ncbi:hypothetical protein [Streptosporangium sp. G12]